MYGWQDRLADRLLGGRPIESWQVGTLANLGMSTQLAAFGICMAVGHPLAFTWVLVLEAVVVVSLFLVPVKQEVSLEHR
jgi:hypothetical protein